MKNNKKGGATVYLVIISILVIAIAFLFIKLNWRRFKAEASFGFTVVAAVLAALLILFLMIRHSIRKARREKEKEKERLEREKFEAEIIAAGGRIAYGKFFDRKAGFISREWLPVFANYRRDGYDRR